MMGRDLMRPDAERHGALRTTEARPVLKGEAVSLRRGGVRRSRDRWPRRWFRTTTPLPAARWRPRCVPDRTLAEMARPARPSLDAMARISGVGAKLDRYGATFLAGLWSPAATAAEMHPGRRRLAGRPGASIFDRLQAAQTDRRGCDARPVEAAPVAPRSSPAWPSAGRAPNVT